MVAGCIYVEQNYNYSLVDQITDVPLSFLDTSVGIGQVKVSTVHLLEENGYIDAVSNGNFKCWHTANRLQNNNEYNADCVAAYLSYLEMRWDGVYDVSNDPKIWGTLYNRSEVPHIQIQDPISLVKKVKNVYWYMEILLN